MWFHFCFFFFFFLFNHVNRQVLSKVIKNWTTDELKIFLDNMIKHRIKFNVFNFVNILIQVHGLNLKSFEYCLMCL